MINNSYFKVAVLESDPIDSFGTLDVELKHLMYCSCCAKFDPELIINLIV